MKIRGIVLAASLALALIMAAAASPLLRTAHAATLSTGCTKLNDPFFDAYYGGAGVIIPLDFNQGEAITITASPGGINMWFGSAIVATTSGNTLVYTFPADLTGVYIWWEHTPPGNANFVVSCDVAAPVKSGDATDGRLDPKAIAGPVALYCDGDALSVYDTSTGDGSLAFSFSEWPTSKPAANTLLKQVGDVALWHLSTGEFQINADGGEGKTYAFVFNGCPYDGGGYNVNLDPNE